MATLQPPRARIARHLVRGLVGLAALLLAFDVAASHPIVAVGAVVVALLSFRGCPTCWMLGWLEVFSPRGAGTSGTNCSID